MAQIPDFAYLLAAVFAGKRLWALPVDEGLHPIPGLSEPKEIASFQGPQTYNFPATRTATVAGIGVVDGDSELLVVSRFGGPLPVRQGETLTATLDIQLPGKTADLYQNLKKLDSEALSSYQSQLAVEGMKMEIEKLEKDIEEIKKRTEPKAEEPVKGPKRIIDL